MPSSRALDDIAIVGVGTAKYGRGDNSTRTMGSVAIDACTAAIIEAGIDRLAIDGICGSIVHARYIQGALGLGEVTWIANPEGVIGNLIVAAVNAIRAGACSTALVYHSVYRHPGRSRSAARDPFRVRSTLGMGDGRALLGAGHVEQEPIAYGGAAPYAAWANRYLSIYSASREHLGYIAINDSSNAQNNDNAVMRDQLTMDEYMNGRLVRYPLGIYDMDVPIDGADAFVITSTERAADLANQPVLIHAATLGLAAVASEEQQLDFDHTGQSVVAKALWSKSDLSLEDVDVYFPYDGFSIIPLIWMESIGWCKRGEAKDFIESNWDSTENRLKINGRILVNPHGGSLREGGTQGGGHLREAYWQLRGRGSTKSQTVPKVALITPGGMFYNSQGLILRTV